MDRGNIFSGGAFRVTVYATLILAIVFLLTAVSGYVYLQDEQFEQSRDRGKPVIELFQQIYADGGDAAVLAHLAQVSSWARPTSKLLGVYHETGEIIGGAYHLIVKPQDWHVRSVVTNQDTGTAEEFYLTSVSIGSHTFVIGEAIAPLQRVETIFIRTLMFIGTFLSLAFVALGYLTSRSVQVKLEHMDQALGKFAGGNIDIRLPVSNSNDQIDRVSSTMNRQLDRLARLMADTKTSATAIAHDLKRPLAHVMLGVEHALSEAEKGNSTQATLEDIQVELSKLNSVFETILRISHIDAGHGLRPFAKIDLIAIAADLTETFEVVAEESRQSMHFFRPQAPHLMVVGDAGMIIQLVANLLQNAITHGAAGNRITLALKDEAKSVALEITDTGPGIPEADCARVFDAFFRAEVSRSTQGNGLGLTLVKSIADRHGATIILEDNAPGLRVIVRFPKA